MFAMPPYSKSRRKFVNGMLLSIFFDPEDGGNKFF
jgi:hypothetical protein